jgi:hypothetical protein
MDKAPFPQRMQNAYETLFCKKFNVDCFRSLGISMIGADIATSAGVEPFNARICPIFAAARRFFVDAMKI